jgi:hypothetical protein
LDIREAGRIRRGSWTIINSVDPVSGQFSALRGDYKVHYNLVEDDGTYSTVVLKRESGIRIIV